MSVSASSRLGEGRRQRRGRRCVCAFTLVEMLVAMAVTLILILALSQAFVIVGESVAQGRAAIELSGNLRSVANQLQEDLTGLTVPVRPWTEDRSGEGYLEAGEGPLNWAYSPSSDKDWNGNGTKETTQDSDSAGGDDISQDTNSNSVADILESDLALATQTHYGDTDDFLAFTSRNATTPFVGQRTDTATPPNTYTVQSSLAEVIWWIQYDDRNDSGTRDADESFTIYRRVMLIRPELGAVRSWVGASAFATSQPGLILLKASLEDFFNNNDISVRLRWWVVGGNVNVTLTANSLADLTRRENRFGHLPILSDHSPVTPPQYKLANVAIAREQVYDALPMVLYVQATDRVLIPGFGFPMDVNRRSVTSLYRAPKTLSSGHYGEDVMVSNALAFDVHVFDPTAPLRNGLTAEALVPSDPGYDAVTTTAIGYGAFVDLGYGSYLTPTSSSLSTFSGGPQANSRLVLPLASGAASTSPVYAYCTWSGHYERNGVDDDVDGTADEGTDGFDSDGNNGVDDVGERETSPPYPVPLRGVQVKIRAIDPDSRQIRQVTVVSDFIPE